VTDCAPDPPLTLKAAEKKFSAFLASQNYPPRVCWIALGDLLVDKETHFWIRPRASAEEHAAQRYAQGLGRKLGIELRAICATDAETFASVFIPEDDVDSLYHLMGRGLKLTSPLKRYPTSTVRNSGFECNGDVRLTAPGCYHCCMFGRRLGSFTSQEPSSQYSLVWWMLRMYVL
jgi:hypothetical protein